MDRFVVRTPREGSGRAGAPPAARGGRTSASSSQSSARRSQPAARISQVKPRRAPCLGHLLQLAGLFLCSALLPAGAGSGPSLPLTSHHTATANPTASQPRRDAERYRAGYPDLELEDPRPKLNQLFYNNEIPCEPHGDFIDNIHAKWFGNHALLERHHGYIQWLFPIPEPGLNMEAQPLTLPEARHIAANNVERVRRSYEMMLDFYGMQLVNAETGAVARSSDWRARFRNIVDRRHNFLRITRILKSLSYLGLDHYKTAWMDFILHEVFETRAMAGCATSAINYWLPMIKRRKERWALAEKYSITLDEDLDLVDDSEEDEDEEKGEEEEEGYGDAAEDACGAASMVESQPTA